MKKMGLVVAIFFGAILLTSTVALSLPNIIPSETNPEVEFTGTPADNFPPEARAQFCGSGESKTTPFVKEFSIPTPCTNPLAITTDADGNVWFVQTNTGNLAKFDPVTETFSEIKNPSWPKNGRSMMWGIDYSPDNSLWYTDEVYDSIWRYSIDDKKYQRLDYPSNENSLPQKIKVDGSQIIINDFTGNKITFLDPNQSDNNLKYISLPSPIDNSVTSDFTIDMDNNIWYTNWIVQQGGVLVKFNQEGYRNSIVNINEVLPVMDFIEIFELPPQLFTPNGIVYSDGQIWLADTSSSSIFEFDPISKQFTQYPTSDPKLSTYGNYTGVIKSPISRPYWIDSNSEGHLIFNEQTSNSIALMDLKNETLVEYLIPSKNPNWGDCAEVVDCGLAQVFDFTINGEKIWFTEWVENNIGVVDTSVPLPFKIELESKDLTLKIGESTNLSYLISSQTSGGLPSMGLILSSGSNLIELKSDISSRFSLNETSPIEINVEISAPDTSIPGTYKILVGAEIEEVSISKFLTITIVA